MMNCLDVDLFAPSKWSGSTGRIEDPGRNDWEVQFFLNDHLRVSFKNPSSDPRK